MTERLASYFMNKPVISKNGKEIGAVEDVYLNTDGWNVESLRVKLSSSVLSELKPGKNVLLSGESVKVPMRSVSGVRDNVTLTQTMEDLVFEDKLVDQK